LRSLLIAALLLGGGAHAGDSTVRLATGSRTVFELSENPSTGYSWRIDESASEGLDLVRITDEGHRRGANLPGAPGVHRWTIRAVGPGVAAIKFAYQRPWEPEPVETRQVAVEISRRRR
jgi:inhibitor of cysteine peptidase